MNRQNFSVVLSLSSSTYHFSDPTPPQLTLTMTSNRDRPLTIFTWGTFLWPKLALAQRQFVITDLTDGIEVPQTSTQIQRMPFTRIRGSGDEIYYLTTKPDTPVTVSTPFDRAGNTLPQPKAVVQQGWELDEHGHEMKYAEVFTPTV